MPRERGGEKKRGLTEPKPGRAGDRGTQRLTGGADSALCLSGGHLRDRSLCDCLVWAKAAKGMTDRTGQDRTGLDRRGQVRTAGRTCMGFNSLSHQQENRFHRKHHTV